MRAQWLAKNDEFAHAQDGVSVNEWLRRQHYPLPDWYVEDGNNVESLVRWRAPYSHAADALEALVHSEAHSRHVLGLTRFFSTQELFGIGYAKTQGKDQFFWVVLTSHTPDFV
jgi:hypothetical protein